MTARRGLWVSLIGFDLPFRRSVDPRKRGRGASSAADQEVDGDLQFLGLG